ncbi:unnamed protein product [Prunus armeniaca]
MSNMEASPTPTTNDTPQVVGDGAATLLSRPPTSGKIKPIRKASEVWKHFIKEPFELGSNIGPRASSHFIDDSWKLYKRIINFCQITNHRGEAIGRLVEDCLHDWGIDKVFTITLDNATANDGAIRHMKRQLKLWGTLLLDGDCLHMRCCAHILNLIVFDGLSELHDSIKSIRKACVYTRSSPSRLDKFRHCLALQKIDSKGLLPLECKTRWNSIYLMLEAALKLQRGFDRLEEEAGDYASYFHQSGGNRDDGIPKKKKRKVQEGEICTKQKLKSPTVVDWEYARTFVKFLKRFYEATLKFSAYETVTSNTPFNDMLSIIDKLNAMIVKVNQVLIVAVVLDPRYKMDYIQYSFDELESDDSKVTLMVEGVKDLLMRMYEAYKKEEPAAAQSTAEANVESEGEIAWDVFAVPVSSVPLEAAFSMGKRVVDPFRASLTPKTIKALVCTKDWLSQVAFDFNKQPSEDDLEFYQALEKMESGTAIFKLCNGMEMNKWPLATNAYCKKLKKA